MFSHITFRNNLQSYLMDIDSSMDPFVVKEYMSRRVDLSSDVDLVRKQSKVLPKRSNSSYPTVSAVQFTWFSFIHRACRFFNFNNAHGRYWRKFPSWWIWFAMKSIVSKTFLPLTFSTFKRDKRPISSGRCVKQFERTERILKHEQLPIYFKSNLSHHSLLNHLLTLAGIDWIWLWSMARNCKRCNCPILVGIDVKLLNERCNSTNEVILKSMLIDYWRNLFALHTFRDWSVDVRFDYYSLWEFADWLD